MSKFDVFIRSGSPVMPRIKSADSCKLEFVQFSPSKCSPLPSYGISGFSVPERFFFLQIFFEQFAVDLTVSV